MRQRCETVEHPFRTMKARMGATHFLTKTLPKVAAEMVLSVLASPGHQHRRDQVTDRRHRGLRRPEPWRPRILTQLPLQTFSFWGLLDVGPLLPSPQYRA
jgi:hypothetical protein